MGLQTFDETSPFVHGTTFNAGSGTGFLTIANPAPFRVRVDAILAASTAAAGHHASLFFFDGSATNGIGAANIAAGVGIGGVASVDFLAACLPSTVTGLVIPANGNLQVALDVALAGGELIVLTVLGGYV